MQDLHSGGTVCSPTRATVLTGRNHFRDCVDYVFGCSDMTECVPDFEFAPSRTFTVGDAVRAAGEDYEDGAIFLGKVRLRGASISCKLSAGSPLLSLTSQLSTSLSAYTTSSLVALG